MVKVRIPGTRRYITAPSGSKFEVTKTHIIVTHPSKEKQIVSSALKRKGKPLTPAEVKKVLVKKVEEAKQVEKEKKRTAAIQKRKRLVKAVETGQQLKEFKPVYTTEIKQEPDKAEKFISSISPVTLATRGFMFGARKIEESKAYQEFKETKTYHKIPAVVRTKVLEAPVSAETIHSAAVTTFFSPAMLTTGEIYASLPTTTAVKFKGVEQQIKKDTIKTRIIFEDTAKRKGAAIGVTKIKHTPTGVQVGKTAVVGKVGKVAVKIPTGKTGLVSTKRFIGVSKSVSKPAKVFVKSKFIKDISITKDISGYKQVSKGIVARVSKTATGKLTLKEPTKFIGKGIGFSKKDLTFIGGKTLSPKGDVIAAGVIKKVAVKPTLEIFKASTKTGLKPTITKQASQTTTAIIQAAVKDVPKASVPTITKTLGVTGIAGSTLKTKLTKTETKPISISTTDLKQSSLTAPRVATKVKQVTKQKAKGKTRTARATASISVSKTAQSHKKAVRKASKTKKQPKTRTTTRTTRVPIAPTIPTIRLFPPVIPFRIKAKPKKAIKRKKRKRITDAYLPAGFTARVVGLKKAIPKKSLVAEEKKLTKALGLRPALIVK